MIKKRCAVCGYTARMPENDEKCFRCGNMTMMSAEDEKRVRRYPADAGVYAVGHQNEQRPRWRDATNAN
ncbi:MAG: hypothetical protein ACOYU3_07455 [Bacillota bacterium]